MASGILGISTGEVKHTKRRAAWCSVVWIGVSGNLPSQFTRHEVKLNDRGLLFLGNFLLYALRKFPKILRTKDFQAEIPISTFSSP